MSYALRLLVFSATIGDDLAVVAVILLVALELRPFIKAWCEGVLSGLESIVHGGLHILVVVQFLLFDSRVVFEPSFGVFGAVLGLPSDASHLGVADGGPGVVSWSEAVIV